ncbi:MAG TPA: transporter substrate-binding domain-containing protein [Streptosporangiaceae bacterium]|nr:transporter substrate-binding domain-containing protein [Streptosporangiaceae bacterium]
MSLRRRIASGAGLCAAALLITACGGSTGATVQGAKLVREGRLTTCTHLPYPPFQSTQGGKIVGFDVDMIDLVAKKLGVTQQIVDTSFETIKGGAALNAGKCDVAAAGMTIKPERAKFLDFSSPYFNATQALMARKDAGIASLDDVRAKKLKIGSQGSTTGEDYVRSKGFDPQSFDNSAAELDGLRTGQVDVIVQDYPVVQGWLKDPANAKFALVANLNTGEQYGFAVKKDGNDKLLEIVNAAIAQAKRDGTYKRIYEKWIGPCQNCLPS